MTEKKKNKHIGSSFDDFLKEEGLEPSGFDQFCKKENLREGETFAGFLRDYVRSIYLESGGNETNSDLIKLVEVALAEEFERGEQFACVGCRLDAKNKRVGHSCSKMGMLR